MIPPRARPQARSHRAANALDRSARGRSAKPAGNPPPNRWRTHMGWTHTPGASKEDVVRELLTDCSPLDFQLQEHVLWAVIDDDIHGRYIVCFLLRDAGEH